ncbi:MAG TPA: DUF305 domain-containing protein [Candidatus Levybacteria bacterium]|nr:DUF305 domain-containing protein [Candidatus Levybacteria bacterium]
MKTAVLIIFTVGILLGGAVGYGIVPRILSQNVSSTTVTQNNSDLLDQYFIQQMIPHHEDAIIISKLAEQHAQRPEIQQLAKTIIADQSNEIHEMEELYKKWYNKNLPQGHSDMHHHGVSESSEMHMGMIGTNDDITRMTESEDFDKAYIEHMIPHHQMAVMMADLVKAGTTRGEIKTRANTIITAQTKEIDQMRTWYQSWYNN